MKQFSLILVATILLSDEKHVEEEPIRQQELVVSHELAQNGS